MDACGIDAKSGDAVESMIAVKCFRLGDKWLAISPAVEQSLRAQGFHEVDAAIEVFTTVFGLYRHDFGSQAEFDLLPFRRIFRKCF